MQVAVGYHLHGCESSWNKSVTAARGHSRYLVGCRGKAQLGGLGMEN